MILPKMHSEDFVSTYFAPDGLLGGEANNAGAGGGQGGEGGTGGDGGAGGDGGGGQGGEFSGPEWLAGLSEDLRGNEALHQYETLEDAVKASLELQGKVPTVPESVEGYTPPEGIQDEIKALGVDADEAIKEWAKNAKDMGLPLEVAQKLFQREVQNARDQREGARTAAQEQIQNAIKQTKETLQTEWKNDFQKNLDAADQAFARVFDEDTVAAIKASGLSYNPGFVKAMHAISPYVNEDTIENLRGQGSGQNAGGKKSIADRLYDA